MDAHVPKYAANALGLVFAAVGFGLSIFALIVSSLLPLYQLAPEDFVYLSEKEIRRTQSSRPSGRDFRSSLPSLEASSRIQDHQVTPTSSRNSLSSAKDAPNSQWPMTLRKPTSLTFSQPSTPPTSTVRNSPPNSSKTVWVSTEVVPQKPSKFAGLAPPWKEHEPKLTRQMSSPHLTRTSNFLTAATSTAPTQLSTRIVPCKRIEKILMLRRCKSLPSSSRNKSSICSPRKRPQISRTQPYEAPYFAPLPQPVSIEKQEAPRRKRPHRSRTLDSLLHRSTFTFQSSDMETPPLPPLPPSFTRQKA